MGRWELGGDQSANACLNVLPPEEYRRVVSAGEVVEVRYAQILHEPGGRITSAWFPLGAIVSLQLALQVGGEIEIAMAGREAMVGVPLFLGADRATDRARVQVGGDALRVDAATFRELARKLRSLRTVMERYTEALLALTAQNIGCVRSHPIPQRTARWLLVTHDRIASDRFDLTQDLLSQMLQVRRASVSETQSRLQERGYIRYSRGNVEIVDREALEGLTCECYWTVRRLFEERVHGLAP